MENKLKIMISAYACEPEKGSEPGVGWNWVLQLSRYFELWVLTREANRAKIEEYLPQVESKENIHFIYFDLPKWARLWKKGMRGVRLYYMLWVNLSNSIVRRKMQENSISVYHHLTYGNSLWNVSSYGMKQFFIWGPTGGVDTIPAEYSKRYSVRNQLVEVVRRMIVRLLPVNIGYQKRCKAANLILCKTDKMRNAVPVAYREKAVLFTDVASEAFDRKLIRKKGRSDTIEYIVVGKLDAWRGMDLAIEAIAQLKDKYSNVHLTVVGEGKDMKRLKSLAKQRGVKEYVEFIGDVAFSEYHRIIRECDVVLNPALKEGAVTVSFDSMSYGKPLICVDTGGYTRNLNEKNALVIKAKSNQETVKMLSDAMEQFVNAEKRADYGSNAYKSSKLMTWEYKGDVIFELFEKSFKKANIV